MADIELVIKINEKYLKDIKECVNNGVIDYGPWASIANGTPLPQGHGRLIDADVLREEVYSWGMNDYEPSDFIDVIDHAPIIIDKEGE